MQSIWTVACHESDVASHGDFVVIPWGSRPTAPYSGTPPPELAVSNIDGNLFAWDNRCVHRGARVYRDEWDGNREARCAYHGFLNHPEKCTRFQLQRMGPWVLVRRGRPDQPGHPDRHEIQVLTRGTEHMRQGGVLRFTMDCRWDVAVENALDHLHVEHVHAGSLGRVLRKSPTTEYDGNISIDYFEMTDAARRELDAMSDAFIEEDLHWPWPCDYVHLFLPPYTCLSSTRGYTWSLQHYIPRPDGRTEFIHRLYCARTRRPMQSYFLGVSKLNDRVFREDAEICADVQPGGGMPGFLTPADGRVLHFRSIVAGYL